MLGELLNLNLFGFFLVFARVGTAIAFLPGFSAAYVSPRIRLLLALTVTLVVLPMLIADLPVIPESPVGLTLLILSEALIGSFFGILGRIAMGALHTAGTMIAYLSSMANAFVQDPISEQQGSVISGFLMTVGVVLVFVMDVHHLMLRAIIQSYSLFIPGEMPMLGDLAQVVARRVMDSFFLGVQLASPFLVTGITHYVMLGILGRLMPALPVFFFGLPIQIATQLSVMILVLSSIMLVFMTRFSEMFGAFVTP
ncbi:MAG: flagellar biosynthetic protein FliR [Rhodospirillales bacterium]|nr:flagellar biosynthetic protein FliR [Rhodospirillales bacterium]